ncbi:MAG: hypothetical protein EHM93_19005 [Bacteroidales bacterium]|nr:MAG: hypothetical protein EHM93_19005 [Bacteroidales bacterium]
MKKLLIVFSVFIAIQVNGQVNDSTIIKADKLSIGLGMGLDYGGFGGNLVVYPGKNLGLFAGAGYNLLGLGFNGGLKIRFNGESANKIKPYLLAMYGYNAVIAVKGETSLNKTFYGPTLGFGLDFRQRPGRKGYFTLALLVPIRSSEVKEYMDDLKENNGVEFKNELSPVSISIGYRLVIGQ